MDIKNVLNFLGCETPIEWCKQAASTPDLLLIDHAHCEKKAASTAIMMLFRYPEHEDLVYQLSRIAREELRHFEKVLAFLKKRKIAFRHLEPANYAADLRKTVANHEPERLIDLLIISAFIEARSCERFAKLIPWLDEEMGLFYHSLLVSEARHFEIYINFAKKYAQIEIETRIQHFKEIEKDLILNKETNFRFHSGAPIVCDS